MKMKRFLSLVLAMVMSLALAAPASAAEASPELEVSQSTDAAAPRYAVYTVGYTLDMDNHTYAELVFCMAEKSGKFYFERVDSISFRNTNPNGSHWGIEDYNYTIGPNLFTLYITARDMEGNKPSSDYRFNLSYSAFPEQVMSYSRSAQDGNGVKLAPESVRVSWPEAVMPVKGENGIKLAPTSVSVSW